MEHRENWFQESETYKAMNRLMELEDNTSPFFSGDEFIANFMVPDYSFESEKDELKHLKNAQSVLRDELLTAYEFLEEKGLLGEYKSYRSI